MAPVMTAACDEQFTEARAVWDAFRRKNPEAQLIQLHRENGRVYLIVHHPASPEPQLNIDAAALADHYRTEGLMQAA